MSHREKNQKDSSPNNDAFANAFSFYDASKRVEISHRRLPHWEQASCTYFITFRTEDSLPAPILASWHQLRAIWLEVHGIDVRREGWKMQLQTLPEKLQLEFQKRFNKAFHEHLDAGYGECLLKNVHVRSPLIETFHFFDGQRYALGDYVVMPNHVHALVWFPQGEISMKRQCRSWKRVSSLAINRLLGRCGHFWQGESYDHIVRSQAQFDHYRNYIAENPVKAKLREGEYTLYIRKE